MRHIKILTALFVLSVTVSGLSAQTKRYEVKSGIIEYTINGGGDMMGIKTKIKGTAKNIFKDWGNLELHDEAKSSIVMGMEEHQREMTKIDGKDIYVVDFDKKVIVKYAPEMLLGSEYKDLAKSDKEMMISMGGKKIGEDKILGYACEVWEMLHTKIWIHKGIPLKSEANVMGMNHITEATSVQLNVQVPDEKLKLPDFPVKNMKEMMQERMNPNGDMKDTPGQMPQMTPEQLQQMQEMMKSFGQK